MERIADTLEGSVTRVATGGLAPTIVPHCRSVDTIGVSSEDATSVVVRGLRMPKHPNYEVFCHTADTVEEILDSGLPTTATIDLATATVILVTCIAND